MKAWKIKDWGERRGKHRLFVCAQSAAYDNPAWLPVPINLTGERFRVLMASAEGQQAFGVFMALCQLAAHCRVKGVIVCDSGAFTPRALHAKTGISPKDMATATAFLEAEEIGWLQPLSERQIKEYVRKIKCEQSRSKPSGTYPPEQEAEQEQEHLPASPIPPSPKPQEPEGKSAGTPACLPAPTTYAQLAGCGVEEPALSLLAASPSLNPADVLSEWRQIQKRGRAITSPVGALVRTLEKRTGVKVARGGHISGALAEATRLVMQRRRAMAPSPTRASA